MAARPTHSRPTRSSSAHGARRHRHVVHRLPNRRISGPSRFDRCAPDLRGVRGRPVRSGVVKGPRRARIAPRRDPRGAAAAPGRLQTVAGRTSARIPHQVVTSLPDAIRAAYAADAVVNEASVEGFLDENCKYNMCSLRCSDDMVQRSLVRTSTRSPPRRCSLRIRPEVANPLWRGGFRQSQTASVER
jgi:hypothetical protein